MEKQMLRATLEAFRQRNELKVCRQEVDLTYELGAVLKHYRNEVPILFEKVKGHRMPVAGALFGERQAYYDMMKMTPKNRLFKMMAAVASPQPVKHVTKAPVKEEIITTGIHLEKMFPIPKFHEQDSSTYITSGIVALKDPDTGKTHLSVRRLQVNGAREVSVLVASPLARQQYAQLEAQNKPLEIAIILGYDHSLLLASQISSQLYGVDKYEVDSALRGEALELVSCHQIDLSVPAHAEIVLEGVMPPRKRKPEGPFGELMGYYGGVGDHPVAEIKTVLQRKKPIFQTAFPCREEHLSNGLIREMELYQAVKNVAGVADVNVTVAGGCRFHAVVSLHEAKPGEAKSAILAALGSNKDLKQVIIVDDDINIYDPEDVELAVATRFQASRDLVVIPEAVGSGLDPSNGIRGVSDKMGIDATAPSGEMRQKFHRAIIPGYEKLDIGRYFPEEK
ncbi:2,5-furandicarboxylate decarboxylase 1 [Tindallia magadiensis]|uniref:2,5-furandicarboxylate decarboxylase 1 n=1 Tax=Tindallia magadiensis TaxID=69895 RepID=A0A1I3ETK8_9FIRM|nr:UbiD family decarboxylase [Tindallia magadiensis]SFI02282.1 2,5-furandicarboxylate decarboxylase 1 [Tindallia magadiensis]